MTAGMPADWPPPLRLIAAALTPGGDMPADLARSMSPDDWRRFAHLVIERHRVAPVVLPRLTGLPVPPEVRAALRDEVRANARTTLATMAELGRVLREFAALGVAPVVLKGIPLAEDLYGAPAGRHAADCDLLIPAHAVAACSAVLARLGHRPAPPHRLRDRVAATAALHAERNEIEFEHPDSDAHIELHWRPHHFVGWPDPLAGPGAVIRRRTSIGEVSVPADGPNLIYLAMHGSLHRWGRLKWLADLARLARRRAGPALDADFEAARAGGMETPVALGLRLAARLMGAPLPAALEAPSRRLARMEEAVLATIASDAWAIGTLRARLDWYVNSIRMGEGLRQKLGVVRYTSWGRIRLLAADLTRG